MLKISLRTNIINTVFEDKKGNILIGSESGLYLAKENNEKVYKIDLFEMESVPIRNLHYVNNNLFVATSFGIFLFENYQDPLTPFNKLRLNKNASKFITSDTVGHIWSATNKGIDEYKLTKNKELKLIKNYQSDMKNLHSLSSNFIRSLLIDKT